MRRACPLRAPIVSTTSTCWPIAVDTLPSVAGTRCLSILLATLMKYQPPALDAANRSIRSSQPLMRRLRSPAISALHLEGHADGRGQDLLVGLPPRIDAAARRGRDRFAIVGE